MDNIQPVHSTLPKNIPIDILIGYSEQGLTGPEIGKLVGCSPNNIYERFQRINYTPEYLKSYKKHKADLLAQKQRELLSALDSDAIKRMQPRDVVMAYGILYDKERIERGQAGQILGFEGLPDTGLSQAIGGLLAKAERIGLRITDIVGDLPSDLRDKVGGLLPSSHAEASDDTTINDTR